MPLIRECASHHSKHTHNQASADVQHWHRRSQRECRAAVDPRNRMPSKFAEFVGFSSCCSRIISQKCAGIYHFQIKELKTTLWGFNPSSHSRLPSIISQTSKWHHAYECSSTAKIPLATPRSTRSSIKSN